jgi:excisionase family DNA binding protein
VTTPTSRQTESYGKAELRLRLLLLGDGIDTAGHVRGEASRDQVKAELRRMRSAFDAAVLEADEDPTPRVDQRVGGLEDELKQIASFRSRGRDAWPDAEIPALVTPAEAAAVLRVSVASVYRAIRSGEISAARLTGKKRGALRIPVSELQRVVEARPLPAQAAQRID